MRASQQETPSSMSNRLGGLKELYHRVDDMFQLQFPKALCIEDLEDVLDGSLRVSDVCGTVRDVLSFEREGLQGLECSLRRRTGRESGLEGEIRAYMVTRKEMNKMIRNLKGMDRKCKSMVLSSDSEMVGVVNMLREAEEISLPVFDSLFIFSFASKAKIQAYRLAYCFKTIALEACIVRPNGSD